MFSSTERARQATQILHLTQKWRSYGVAVLFVLFLAYSGTILLTKGRHSEWQHCFMQASQSMLRGQTLHHPGAPGCYSYPPIMALMCTPLAGLSMTGSLACWWMVNVAAASAWFVCSWRLAGGPRLMPLPTGWGLVLVAALIVSIRWIMSPLEHQQFDLVIAGLLLGGCYLLWRGHSLGCGALLGAATAMKCTPLLFAPYLLWRRKPGAALMLVVVAIGLNLLPDLLLPKADGCSYLADWVRFTRGQLGATALGSWQSDVLLNQSLAGLFGRLARFGLPLSMVDWQAVPVPGANAWLKLATYGAGAALLAATWQRFGRYGQTSPTVSASQMTPVIGADRLQLSWEVSALLCLMLLLSPMTSKAHFVVLLLPCLLLARQLVESPSMGIRVIYILLLICGPLTTKGLIGKSLGDLTLVWGLPTWFVLVVWFVVWRTLGRSSSLEHGADALRPRSWLWFEGQAQAG